MKNSIISEDKIYMWVTEDLEEQLLEELSIVLDYKYDTIMSIYENNIDIFFDQITEEDEDENIFTDAFFILFNNYFVDYRSEVYFIFKNFFSKTLSLFFLQNFKVNYGFSLSFFKKNIREFLVFNNNEKLSILYF
jgi:hypothetical protein